jgi:hypothetical protein
MPDKRLKIAVIAGGTRGDVSPALSLSLALAAQGHSVVIAADARLSAFVEEYAAAGAAAAAAAVKAAAARGAGSSTNESGSGGGGEGGEEAMYGAVAFAPLGGDARELMALTVEWGCGFTRAQG